MAYLDFCCKPSKHVKGYLYSYHRMYSWVSENKTC